MTTIINTPSTGQTGNSWIGTIVSALVIALLLVLFFFLGLPLIRSAMNNNANPPSTINVNIPDKIDVNTK